MNKIEATSKTLDANIENNIPVCSNQISLKQERTNTQELQQNTNKSLTYFDSHTNETNSSFADQVQGQLNNIDAQEVMTIFSEITSHISIE